VKATRRKFEEFAWICGLHPLAVRLHRALNERRSEGRAKLLSFYSSFVRPGFLVFDIGANTGAYADVLESLGARVIAVEPNADCIRHIEITYGGRRIEPILAAVGPKNGLLQINMSDKFDDMSTVSSEWVANDLARRGPEAEKIWNRRVTVPCITLDSMVETFGAPDYIKIDIEGYEASVLDGLSKQPEYLSFEYHSFDPNNALRCLGKPVFELQKSAFNITDETGSRFEFAEWTDCEVVKRRLAELTDTYRDIVVRRNGEMPSP